MKCAKHRVELSSVVSAWGQEVALESAATLEESACTALSASGLNKTKRREQTNAEMRRRAAGRRLKSSK